MDNNILLIIVLLAGVLLTSFLHRLYKRKQMSKHEDEFRPVFHHHHPCDCRVPVAVRLELRSITVNNNTITIKGKNMSAALVGKQQVIGTLVPIDKDNNPIVQDPNVPPVDVIQPGSITASSTDVSIVGLQVDPTDQLKLIATSTGDLAGTVTIHFIGRNVNGDLITGDDTITVTLAETTSTSTSTTTTEAPPTVPLATGFQLNWGTPTDV